MRAAAQKLTRALEIFRPVQIEVARQQAITGARFFERADGHPENLRGTPGNGAKHLRHHPARPDQIVAPVRTGAQHNVRGVEQLRSEEHTSELQSRENLVCRLLLEKKKKTK